MIRNYTDFFNQEDTPREEIYKRFEVVYQLEDEDNKKMQIIVWSLMTASIARIAPEEAQKIWDSQEEILTANGTDKNDRLREVRVGVEKKYAELAKEGHVDAEDLLWKFALRLKDLETEQIGNFINDTFAQL